LITIRSEDNI